MEFIERLMGFQRRVLYQARKASVKDALFFTNIFMSNTNEMFQKYDMSSVMDEYIGLVGECQYNYERIIKDLNNVDGITITDEDSFEHRHNSVFRIGRNWSIFQLQANTIHQTDWNTAFVDGDIYYIQIGSSDIVNVIHIDMKHSIYSTPFMNSSGDHTTYWPTVETIRSHFNTGGYKAIAIKVTKGRKLEEDDVNDTPTPYWPFTKIEYSGDTEVMQQISHMFGNALVIRNPYIYTGDIEYIINKLYPSVIEKQIYKPIQTLDMMEDDILIEYPNETFNDYLRFLRSAVDNKQTKAIYLTIYRIGKDPAIYNILKEAVSKGIDVTVNIELMARGDEVANTIWMEEFKAAGIKVLTYAKFELKVHCKLTLVEFHNGKSVAQIGTGNYHTKTATQYTDLNLITADDKICNNIKKVFTKLFKDKPVVFNNEDFLVTRYNFMPMFKRLVAEQIKLGKNGYICIKCNTLEDEHVVSILQEAANAGVVIDLIIRGVCMWTPRQLGTTVSIKSIVWDKLEHSRVMCFGKKDPKIYLGSLDLVSNKIRKRIETMVKATNPNVIWQLVNYINRYATTTTGSWKMQPDGSYRKEKER